MATETKLPTLPPPPALKEGETYDLTEAQKNFFLENGYIKLENCFSREQAKAFTTHLWPRLGCTEDRSTWPKDKERINMPNHNFINVQDFAPRAWSGMCQLIGGEERIGEGLGFKGAWTDGFIVNFGKEEFSADDEPNYRALNNWHNDGDFFKHYLDSPEQALLVIPLWSDIKPKGGGTIICPDGIKWVAQHMRDHPEGTTPFMASITNSTPEQLSYEGLDFWNEIVRNEDKTRAESFVEVTGNVGDVFLLHPLMLHSASQNLRRDVRVITNPPVSLAEPFKLHRGEGEGKYSIVERKTLRELGIEVGETGEGLKDWKITQPRGAWIPSRLKRAEEMRKKEIENLQKLAKQTSEASGDANKPTVGVAA